MQWLLQEFEDTWKLAESLDRLQIPYTWHKVVPFVGELLPEPIIEDPHSVVLFGSYALWRYAEAHDLRPGVIRLNPFVHEKAWHPFLLNGPNARFMTLSEVPSILADDGKMWFIRPVDDSKAEPGKVRSSAELLKLASKVLALDETEIPPGSLRHDTQLMLSEPVQIYREWRIWVVSGEIVTSSLYKEGTRVVYRTEIDDDALAFVREMVDLNPDYSPAYVLDICRTDSGLKIIETNCINAAGLYAADLVRLAAAIDGL